VQPDLQAARTRKRISCPSGEFHLVFKLKEWYITKGFQKSAAATCVADAQIEKIP